MTAADHTPHPDGGDRSSATTSRRRDHPSALFTLFALTPLVVAAGWPDGTRANAALAALGLVAAAAIVTGVRRHHPRPAGPWYLAVAMVLCHVTWALGNAGWHDPATGWRSQALVAAATAGSLAGIAALAGMVRRRGGRSAAPLLFDAAAMGLVTALVVYDLALRPAIADGTATTLLLAQGAYLAVDAVLVFLGVCLVFADSMRLPAVWFLALAVGGVVVADTASLLRLTGHLTDADGAHLLGLAVGALGLVAAARHPSMGLLTEAIDLVRPRRAGIRLTLVEAALALTMALLAFGPVLDGHDRTVVGLLALATLAAVVVRMVRAIAAGDRAQTELVHATRHDRLTGLPQRAQVEDHLTHALHGALRRNRDAAVFIVDVDRFQQVNDTRGSRVGDAVLRELAHRLETAAPPTAMVGRTAGDEFTVAVVDVGGDDALLRTADRLLGVFARPLRIQGSEIYLTGTIGVATNLRGRSTPAHELFRQADTALHRAKGESRGGALLFDDTMRRAVEERVDTEDSLRRALDRGELAMWYQPVLELSNGALSGYEALMRWTRNGTPIGPTSFIHVAEETGLVVPLGAWAIAESLDQLRRWITTGVCARSTSMSVNVAARQLNDPGLVPTVMAALQRAAVPPHQLYLEITETALLNDSPEVERTIVQLKALGVQIALDDFGTGYSSLAHLRRFPIDRIKIDRSFVSNLDTSAEDRALVRSIVVMARELGKDVVAEGVETRSQAMALGAMGCAKGQGYLFSKPLPAEELARRATAPDRRTVGGTTTG